MGAGVKGAQACTSWAARTAILPDLLACCHPVRKVAQPPLAVTCRKDLSSGEREPPASVCLLGGLAWSGSRVALWAVSSGVWLPPLP